MSSELSEKIIDRVKKLKAQAESAAAIGSEAEAQAFAALMQRMMLEHKIREDQLRDPEKKPEPIVELWHSGKLSNDPSRPESIYQGKRVEWAERLADVVARAHYCRIMIREGYGKSLANSKYANDGRYSSSVCFVGRKSDAEAALMAYGLLVDAAAAFGRQEYFIAYNKFRKGEASWERGFYRSFLLGFSDRLAQRYRDELGEVQRELEASKARQLTGEVTGSTETASMALVRIAKDAFQAVDEHFELKRAEGALSTARDIGKGVSNFGAWKKGKEAADRIKLRPDQRLGNGKVKGLLS